MVNGLGLVICYAEIFSALILPLLAQATPDHVLLIDPDNMPKSCLTDCTTVSEKLVNCNRNGTCYCDDIATVPLQACLVCAVSNGYSKSSANSAFDDIAKNCQKYKSPANNLSLSGSTQISLGLATVLAVGGLLAGVSWMSF
ncbi:hypothetical protein FA15DRAFT_642286 [Coprinopsis marcescibilis]|uniref:Uncharacterized protein n=1 Tax=Coprinopsis marcescibilis TaxID=230819 RepID=A0A5C3KTW2_COPMA|nr:hypothetical protein FA15DRAFT_642286 [Coprinopsis marcescibilis]